MSRVPEWPNLSIWNCMPTGGCWFAWVLEVVTLKTLFFFFLTSPSLFTQKTSSCSSTLMVTLRSFIMSRIFQVILKRRDGEGGNAFCPGLQMNKGSSGRHSEDLHRPLSPQQHWIRATTPSTADNSTARLLLWVAPLQFFRSTQKLCTVVEFVA